MTLLTVRDLRKTYGGVEALKGISFHLHAGEVLGIMGPNGSGKTTLIDVISGRQHPDGGCVTLRGRDITGSSLESNGRRGLVRTFQDTMLPPDLKVVDYLLLGRTAKAFERVLPNLIPWWGQWEQKVNYTAAIEWLDFHGLAGRYGCRCCELSAGEQKLLHILRALWRDPDAVLLLDEPTSGLAADQIVIIGRLVKEYVQRGKALAVVSHDQAFVTAVASSVLHLSFGEGRIFDQFEFASFVNNERADRKWRSQRFRRVRPDSHVNLETLSVRDLAVPDGSGYLVQDMNFVVCRGDVLGIVGANGAGKSTLLKAIVNILPRRSGTVCFGGRRLDNLAAHDVARAGLAVVLQGGRVPSRLTVEAALQMAWQTGDQYPPADLKLREAIWHDLRRPNDLLDRFALLARRRRIQSGLLSGGEQMLLAIGLAVRTGRSHYYLMSLQLDYKTSYCVISSIG